VRADRLILTPVRVQRADSVRADLAAVQPTEDMIADAIAWVRQQ